jgi:asparagine synthase (glutamine-hydrolysing)
VGGICGVALDGGRHVVPATDVRPLLRAMKLNGDGEAHAEAAGPAGLGVLGAVGRRASVAAGGIHGYPVIAGFFGNHYDPVEAEPVLAANEAQRLLEAYLSGGIDSLTRLTGDFALAIWDSRDETLVLATDRFRVHPLFYYDCDGAFVFASRLSAVVSSRFVTDRALDVTAIADVIAGSVVPTPKTIFEHVRKLPPAHILRRRRGTCLLEPYWDIRITPADSFDERAGATALKARFADAVHRRLAQERPGDRVGAFLSGGIDSSTVTGVLSRLRGAPIKAFSIGFREEQFDELRYARIAARRFGAEHFEYLVKPHEAVEVLPTLLERCDEPYANSSLIPTYFCARVAREHGTDVLYAGDGGDEIFAGNERYAQWRLFDYYARIPSVLRHWVVEPAAEALARAAGEGTGQLARNYIRRARIPYPARLYSYGYFYGRPLAQFFQPEFVESLGAGYNPYGAVDEQYGRAGEGDLLARQLYLDLKLAVSDNDLFKVNMAGDLAGVAIRYPFLDHDLVDFGFTIPSTVKMRGRRLRSFFKDAYADLLPADILKKKKHGFGLPVPVWLRTDPRFGEMTADLLQGAGGFWPQYVRREAVADLLARSATEPGSICTTIVWNLMVLEMWHRRHSGTATRSPVTG